MSDWLREFDIVTEEHLCSRWRCIGREAFFCAFCGHDFELGDRFRMVYTNDMPGAGGNPLTCEPCWNTKGQYEGLRQVWKTLWDEYKTKFKWFWIEK